MRIDQLAINSISTRHATLEEALDAYAEAGFRHVEFALPQVKEYLHTGKTAAGARGLLEARGLRCIGGFESAFEAFSPPAEREKNHAEIVANAKLVAELGGTTLVVGLDGPSDASSAQDPLGTFAEALAGVAARIAPLDVHLAIEFNWSPIVKSFRAAAEIARRSGASNVGVLFDPAHYHCTPTKFAEITAENVAVLKHIHVNNMLDQPGELSNCNSDRVLPDDPRGCLDLAAIYGALECCGYRGMFAIEMFSETLWSLPARDAARRMYQSMLPLCGS
jgi:2-keto-myo-inositol isomerase